MRSDGPREMRRYDTLKLTLHDSDDHGHRHSVAWGLQRWRFRYRLLKTRHQRALPDGRCIRAQAGRDQCARTKTNQTRRAQDTDKPTPVLCLAPPAMAATSGGCRENLAGLKHDGSISMIVVRHAVLPRVTWPLRNRATI